MFQPLHAAFYDALEALGVPRNPDTVRQQVTTIFLSSQWVQGNGKNDGSMMALLTIDAATGQRSHAAAAYLDPNLGRKNLLILTGAHVTKVLSLTKYPVQLFTMV